MQPPCQRVFSMLFRAGLSNYFAGSHNSGRPARANLTRAYRSGTACRTNQFSTKTSQSIAPVAGLPGFRHRQMDTRACDHYGRAFCDHGRCGFLMAELIQAGPSFSNLRASFSMVGSSAAFRRHRSASSWRISGNGVRRTIALSFAPVSRDRERAAVAIDGAHRARLLRSSDRRG